MAKTKRRKSHVDGGSMGSQSVTLEWEFSSKKKKRNEMKKQRRKELRKKIRGTEHYTLEAPDEVKMEELVKLLAEQKLDGVDDRSCHEKKGIQSGRAFMRSLKDLQVWEVEQIKPGQIMVACPACKLEKSHESSVKVYQEFKSLRNHFKREHKQLKFYLVRSRCLKCPICHQIVSASQLGVHFGQGRPCEKDLLVDQNKVSFKVEGIEEVPGASGASIV